MDEQEHEIVEMRMLEAHMEELTWLLVVLEDEGLNYRLDVYSEGARTVQSLQEKVRARKEKFRAQYMGEKA